MISLLHLNKNFFLSFFFIITFFNYANAATDIWKKQDGEKQEITITDDDKEITIESPILSEDVNKIVIKIDEQDIDTSEEPIIGIFDPEENNFGLNMWSQSDGDDVKNVLKRINKLKLSKVSENLLFQVLFTNAYTPKKNLTHEEFLKIKIDWLIKNKRFENLETLLKSNPEVGEKSKAIKFLVNEYLSSADIKSACEKINFLSKDTSNKYLDKFKIYCFINNDRNEEAQLLLDLLKENGFKDAFYEDKINYLLGLKDTTIQKISDDNLLNFYLSHITIDDFQYEPNDKTDKYIWRYLSSANLVQIDDYDNEEIILAYEQAAAKDSFEKDELFKIYLRIIFNFNQLSNVQEIYKTLSPYKARALVYQSILLSDNIERKLELAFLLKNLFEKKKLQNIYTEELSDILKSIDTDQIPERYSEIVKTNIKEKFQVDAKVKFDNDILHRSKVIKHFLDDYEATNRTEKDFKSVYKKIKKNKKYFISIKDIIVLEALKADGVTVPEDLNLDNLSADLTVPQSLNDLVIQQQTGLVVLKIIEIIGEDKVQDLDPETIYFLSKILNDLNLKKIRNIILSEALPIRA